MPSSPLEDHGQQTALCEIKHGRQHSGSLGDKQTLRWGEGQSTCFESAPTFDCGHSPETSPRTPQAVATAASL